VEDEIVQLKNQIQELKNQNEEYEYQIEKSRDKIVKLERSVSDSLSKPALNSSQNSCVSISTSKSSGFIDDTKNSGITDKQLHDLQSELNEQRELAAHRLVELEKLNQSYQQKIKEIEKLKVDVSKIFYFNDLLEILEKKYIIFFSLKLKSIPTSEIEQSIEYKHLQTKYSVIVNDNVKMKQALDETRNLLEITRSTFQRQIEQMESAELTVQKQLGNEIVQLNEQLTQLKRDNDLLRIEYEQNMAANEQTGPINKEMRSLITTLQTNNKLLKSDNTRLKKKLQEVQEEYEKFKNETILKSSNELDDLITSLETICDKIESNELKDTLKKVIVTLNELKTNQKSSLQTPITQSQEKTTAKSKSAHSKSSNTPSSTDGESCEHHHFKKIKHLEEQIRDLQRSLNNKKLEETALLNDMEITGQAFEDVKEQNTRLMQQLREKDDANFKLMSERLKLENMVKLTEEKLSTLAKDCEIQKAQSEKQLQLTNKLEEQCIYLQQSLAQVEKELSVVQQTCEQFKKSAYEQAFTVQELKLHIHKYSTQLKETQNEISLKAESLAAQVFNNKRLQEEIKHLQLKLERQKKFESASNVDEVLREENREYKEQLRCPSCKVKQKDAVLTKCFHVFCYDCLQKRYELRQRKCPKCNANFGQNDFRKLYLS
jgi:E3 ubiquitin-protein ligase BRE1